MGNNNPLTKKSLFWDVSLEDLNIQRMKYKNFIISRVLEEGNMDDIRWLKNSYPLKDIKTVVIKDRNISSKTRNFWLLELNLDNTEVWKNYQLSQNTHKKLWRY